MSESPLTFPDTALVLKQIEANQEAYEVAARSRKRFIPFWLIRTQYRLVKANEPLFDRFGVCHPPMEFETARGLHWWITRRLIGV